VRQQPWQAAKHGHAGIIQSLLAEYAQLNARNLRGRTALHRAVKYRHADCVRVLLEAKADTTIRDLGGATAFDLAADEAVRAVQLAHAKAAAQEPTPTNSEATL